MDEIDYTPRPYHLSRVHVQNVRAIGDVDVQVLGRVLLVIGENGAGKTSFLDATGTGCAILLAAPFSGARIPVGVNDGRRAADAAAPLNPRVDIRFHGGTGLVATLGGPEGLKLKTEGTALAPKPAYADYTTERTLKLSFSTLRDWFVAKDNEEARLIRERRDLDFRHPDLEAVRKAVSNMIQGATNLRVGSKAGELLVDFDDGYGVQPFKVEELAGGYRTMLALVADLARQLVEAGHGLDGPAIVLIDEVDLHLHPRWQLEVVSGLLRTFPNTQFVLSTHSEEIIASVPSQYVVRLVKSPDGVVARSIPPVEGATFDRVLEDAMGLPGRRPPEHQKLLDDYWRLIDADQGESPEGLALRAKLDALFQGQEPELVRADLAIRRRRATRRTAP